MLHLMSRPSHIVQRSKVRRWLIMSFRNLSHLTNDKSKNSKGKERLPCTFAMCNTIMSKIEVRKES